MNIVFENSKMKLEIDEACRATSLVLKESGEELLAEEKMPLFTVTQERPFNNEIKLIYMNKRTTYPANRVRLEDGKLIVGFELAPYEAVVSIKVADSYITATLDGFIVHPDDYGYLKMDTPPAVEFRLMQLPVKDRANFGKWLNVMWDDEVAVNLLATTPHARIESEVRRGYRILTADAVKGIKLRGCTAALIVSKTDELFDAIDSLENDFDMPRGVQSRRGEMINSSIYWTDCISPANVDEHIKYMKAGGFRLALFYYKTIFQRDEDMAGYVSSGEYNYRPDYPNGKASLVEMLAKLKAAGITPGIHFLHTHIGFKTHYITPKADRRLNTTRKFTLSRPLGLDDTTIYVDEDPTDTVMHPDCRVLMFMGELISYESYTTEPPYRFEGCKRGALKTDIISHAVGEIGGILDISEFSATSAYLDQRSDIQDEIADKISEVYDAGFEFVYYDGSEGVNPPFEFHVPNAQLRVYTKLKKKPLFCEGAAKSHFSWHMLSGANAFDVFPTDIFKPMIDKFPVVAAKEMRKDFTRVNFGWWELFKDTQPDTYEYGMSRAIAWNCPATMIARFKNFNEIPRIKDNLEVIRRWEDAKQKGVITDAQKAAMRDNSDEYTIIINEKGEYEILPYEEIKGTPDGVRAFIFERLGERVVSIWHKSGECELSIPVGKDKVEYFEDFGKGALPVAGNEKLSTINVDSRKYIKTALSKDEIISALKNSIAK